MQEIGKKKKHAFPYRCIEIWNKLDAEVINARNIYGFKSKLDNSRFGDETVRAKLCSCMLQLGNYIH